MRKLYDWLDRDLVGMKENNIIQLSCTSRVFTRFTKNRLRTKIVESIFRIQGVAEINVNTQFKENGQVGFWEPYLHNSIFKGSNSCYGTLNSPVIDHIPKQDWYFWQTNIFAWWTVSEIHKKFNISRSNSFVL